MKSLIFFLTIFQISLSQAQIIPVDRILARYMFEGNLNDSSLNGNDLVYDDGISTLPQSIFGPDRFGKDGSLHLYKIPNSKKIQKIIKNTSLIEEGFSIGYWVNARIGKYMGFFGPLTICNFNIHAHPNEYWTLSDNVLNGMFPYFLKGLSKWQHVVINVSLTDSIVSVYINKDINNPLLFDFKNDLSLYNYYKDTLNISIHDIFAGNDFPKFMLDDLIIFDRQLSVNEIESLWNYPEVPIINSTFNITAKSKTIFVYPNPVSDMLKVSSNNFIHSIKLYDITGMQKLIKFASFGAQEISVEISGLQPGFYFLEAETNKGINTEKIFIR